MHTVVGKRKDENTIQKQRPFFVSSQRSSVTSSVVSGIPEDTPGPGAYSPLPSTAALEAAASSSKRGSGALASHAQRWQQGMSYTGPGPGAYTPPGLHQATTPAGHHPPAWQTFPRAHDAQARTTSPTARGAYGAGEVPGPGAYGAPGTTRHGGSLVWGPAATQGLSAGGRRAPGTAAFLGTGRSTPRLQSSTQDHHSALATNHVQREQPQAIPAETQLRSKHLAATKSRGCVATAPHSSRGLQPGSAPGAGASRCAGGSSPNSSSRQTQQRAERQNQQQQPQQALTLRQQMAAALATAPPGSVERARQAQRQALLGGGCHGGSSSSSGWWRPGEGPGPGAYEVAQRVSLAAELQKKAMQHGYVSPLV